MLEKLKRVNPIYVLCSLLMLLAPLLVTNTASFLLWGEPECPDVLKSVA